MTYLEEFSSSLTARDYNKVLVLWQEYCENDELDTKELCAILESIKESDFAPAFGKYVEAILPLVMLVTDANERLLVLKWVYDLQTSNSQALFELARELLIDHFGQDERFQDKLRLIGLRTRENFQGAISNFLLLNHLIEENCVLHTAGWGVGQIIGFSFLREQISIEFENLHEKKELSFKNAFRCLRPLPKEHFLAQRFLVPHLLEKQAKEDPVSLIMHLLRDLGPKNANEIKDLLNEYVIDAEEYAKWWQTTRAKLKRDGHISVPKDLKLPFSLREEKISPVERLQHSLKGKLGFYEIFSSLYTRVRDFPELVKKSESLDLIRQKANDLLQMENLCEIDRLQVYFFLQQFCADTASEEFIRQIILGIDDLEHSLRQIEIAVMKKRFIQAVHLYRQDWEAILSKLLLIAEPNQLRDYIFKELFSVQPHDFLIEQLEYLLDHPAAYPEAFLWYFQKITSGEAKLMKTQRDRERFFESFLLLLATLEQRKEWRDLVKKMHACFTGQRFKIVRELLGESDAVFAQEFLLLASKCQSIPAHQQKILKSLVDVVHGSGPVSAEIDQNIIWTTHEGYERAKQRIEHIGTVEVVENAREIEAARALGDLRENSEYKFALEKRSRLQNELKYLSDQFHRARVITPDDVPQEVVGIGTRIALRKDSGEFLSFTILGPWDADPDLHILSHHSQLAQSLLGKKVGDSFEFRDESVTVEGIENCLKN